MSFGMKGMLDTEIGAESYATGVESYVRKDSKFVRASFVSRDSRISSCSVMHASILASSVMISKVKGLLSSGANF